jgi:hypothetical protein
VAAIETQAQTNQNSANSAFSFNAILMGATLLGTFGLRRL